MAMKSKATFIIAALVLLAAGWFPAKADIQAVNQCSFEITVFTQNSAGRNQFSVPAGSSVPLNVGTPWVSGVIWGSQTGNTDNGEATQLEFNIAPPDNPTRDFYDISLVNAYNLAAKINVTLLANGDTSSGLECGTITCTIANIDSVCTLNNTFVGADPACLNANGPGLCDTPSIDLFRNACPDAYVQSNDNTNVVYGCDTGSNYDAVWCP